MLRTAPLFDYVYSVAPHVVSHGCYSYRYIPDTGELLRAPRGLEHGSFIDPYGHFHDYWRVRAYSVSPTAVTPLMWDFS